MAAVCGFTSVQQTVEVRQDRSPKMKILLVVNILFYEILQPLSWSRPDTHCGFSVTAF